MNNNKQKENKKTTISVIMGLIGILGNLGRFFLPIFSWFVETFGISWRITAYDVFFLFISLIGFSFGILAKREKEKFALIGIFLSILGMVGGLIFLCLDSGFIQTTQ